MNMPNRRDFLTAAAAAPVVGLLPAGLPEKQVAVHSPSQRYFRIYLICGDGTEKVLDPCLRSNAAEAFVRTYRECVPDAIVEAREIDILSACLLADVPPVPPRWRVQVVCDWTGIRNPVWEFASKEEADELADWFGTQGDLRAEVVKVTIGAQPPCSSWDRGVF